MSRKPFASILSLILITIIVTACSGAAQPTAAPVSPTTAPVSPTAAPASPTEVAPAAGTGAHKVAWVSSEALGDPYSVNTLVGVQKAINEAGGELKTIEAKSDAEYKSTLRSLAQLGYDPIITIYENLAKVVGDVAPEFPKTHFIIFDAQVYPKLSNVKTVTINRSGACYVAGVVAGKLTKSNKVAHIIGEDYPMVIAFAAAFEAGLKSSNPNAQFHVAVAGSWTDPNVGRALALQLAGDGNDVIFDTANLVGLGVTQAAGEAHFAEISDIWRGRTNGYQKWNTMFSGEQALYQEVKSVFDGKFTPGTLDFGLKEGAAVYNSDDYFNLSPENQKLVDDTIAAIKAGSITIPTDTKTR
jgi:basic membrane protein A and related proteins